MTDKTETTTPAVPTKQDLIARITAHEAEGAAIDKLMESMGVTAKELKALKKAMAAKEAAEKTLAALMGVDPAAAEKVGD